MQQIVPVTCLCLFILAGCNNFGTVTTKTITVSYKFDRNIAAASKRASLWTSPGKSDVTIQGAIKGDRTHSSYLIGEVHRTDDENCVFEIKSPGHAGTESLTFDRVTINGNTLTAHYTKKTPEVNTDDFRQMTHVIDITFQ